MTNQRLHRAKQEKNDEYYTLLEDIENEPTHYPTSIFKNKHVHLPCDDPAKSKFFTYFTQNSNRLQLAKLTATHYTPGATSTLTTITQNPENTTSLHTLLQHPENTQTPLDNNGDFRHPDNQPTWQAADIIVTNPPFSLARAFFIQLIKTRKNFIAISNLNTMCAKQMAPYITRGQIRLGASHREGKMTFRIMHEINTRTDQYETENGERYAKVGNVLFFTNQPHDVTPPPLQLTAQYTPETHTTYDNYPHAVNCDRPKQIPADYTGQIGVPITYLLHHNPQQFQIIGFSSQLAQPTRVNGHKVTTDFVIGNVRKYTRVVIQARH